MPTSTPAPPPEPACLFRPYPSSQKGGTLIATDVVDLVAHMKRMCSPDGYRPERCPTCEHPVMHAHDRRTRQCHLDGAPPVIPIARHRCAHPDCRAKWQTLPAFVARHLHFHWRRIETATAATGGSAPRRGRRPSPRSVRRWLGRLGSSAVRLVGLFADGGRTIALGVRTRAELARTLALSLGAVAAWVHELMPGVRLM